jgi:hypothetical protein
MTGSGKLECGSGKIERESEKLGSCEGEKGFEILDMGLIQEFRDLGI